MNPDDLTADLPPPRDDEPASLRRDIVDELTDHLHCSLHREQLANPPASGGRQPPDGVGDPGQTAWQTVLTRFGNPSAIARRLWWDHMWETVMTKRLTLATLCVLTAAVVGMFLLTWRALATTEAIMQQSQQASLALLTKIEQLTQSAPAANYDWCNLRVRLVSDDTNGPQTPVSAATVGLKKLAGGQADAGKLYPYTELTSNADGQADFSPVPYGHYYLTVNIDDHYALKKEITIRPGQDVEELLVCPTGLSESPVRLTFDRDGITVLDDLDGRLWLLCRIQQPGFYVYAASVGAAIDGPYGGTEVGGNRWWIDTSISGLLHPDGRFIPVEWPTEQPPPQPDSGGGGGGFGGSGGGGFGGGGGGYVRPVLTETFTLDQDADVLTELHLLPGEYACDGELVVADQTLRTFQLATAFGDLIVVNDREYDPQDLIFRVDPSDSAQWTFRPGGMTGGLGGGSHGSKWLDGFLARDQEFDNVLVNGIKLGGGGFGGGGGGFF